MTERKRIKNHLSEEVPLRVLMTKISRGRIRMTAETAASSAAACTDRHIVRLLESLASNRPIGMITLAEAPPPPFPTAERIGRYVQPEYKMLPGDTGIVVDGCLRITALTAALLGAGDYRIDDQTWLYDPAKGTFGRPATGIDKDRGFELQAWSDTARYRESLERLRRGGHRTDAEWRGAAERIDDMGETLMRAKVPLCRIRIEDVDEQSIADLRSDLRW